MFPIPTNPTPIEQVEIEMPNPALGALAIIVAALTLAVLVVVL